MTARPPMALDIETCGEPDQEGRTAKDVALDHKRNKLVGLGWYVSETEQEFIVDPAKIKSFLLEAQKHYSFIWHNGKFDQKTLAEKLGIWVRNDFDTQRAAGLLPHKPISLALDSLVYKFFGESSWKEDEVRGSSDAQAVAPYCLKDCRETMRLYGYEQDHLRRAGQLEFFHNFMMPLTDMLARAEFRGVEIDLRELQAQWDASLQRLAACEDRLTEKWRGTVQPYVDAKVEAWKQGMSRAPTPEAIRKKYQHKTIRWNWSSNTQVLWLLREKFGFQCRRWDQKKKKNVDSVDDEVLNSYAGQHEIIADLLEHRRIAKLEGYFPQWRAATFGSRIYTHFNEEGARRTGRLSASDPNLQQFPNGDCRKIIIARPGYSLYDVDLSQIEPKILAERSGDAVLRRAVSGEDDLYATIIKAAKGLTESPAEIKANRPEDRTQGKVLLLSKIYGAGPFNIAKQLGITPAEATNLMEQLNKVMPGVQEYTKTLIRQVEENGCVETLMGRRLWISKEELFSKSRNINLLNYDTQGSAGDFNSALHILLDRWITKNRFPAYLLLLVHDEGLYEVATGREKEFDEVVQYVIQDLLPKKLKIKVPIRGVGKWGATWAIKN